MFRGICTAVVAVALLCAGSGCKQENQKADDTEEPAKKRPRVETPKELYELPGKVSSGGGGPPPKKDKDQPDKPKDPPEKPKDPPNKPAGEGQPKEKPGTIQ